MKLAQYDPPVRAIDVETAHGPDTFEVSGLSLNAISYLMRVSSAPLATVYQAAMEGHLSNENVFLLVNQLSELAPDLVARIIACATGEPESWPVAAGLPISTQVEAVAAIIELTTAGDPGGKKLLATIGKLLPQMAVSPAA